MAKEKAVKPVKEKVPENLDDPIQGYCTKGKCKVVIQDAVIHRTARGAYMAKGKNADGGNVVSLLGKDRAKGAVAAGHARFEEGHEPTD